MSNQNHGRIVLKHGETVHLDNELVIEGPEAPVHGGDLHHGLSRPSFADHHLQNLGIFSDGELVIGDVRCDDLTVSVYHGGDFVVEEIGGGPVRCSVEPDELDLNAPARPEDVEGLHRTLARGFTGATADEAAGVFRTLGRGHKRGVAKRRSAARR